MLTFIPVESKVWDRPLGPDSAILQLFKKSAKTCEGGDDYAQGNIFDPVQNMEELLLVPFTFGSQLYLTFP